MSHALARYNNLGAVAVPTTSIWADANKMAATLISPLRSPLDAVLQTAGFDASDRTKMTTRPLDCMLDIFDPIEDAVGRAVDRVMKSRGATQNFFGTRINLTRVQAVDLKADASTQNLMRSLRTMQAFIVLLWTQPAGLAYEMGVEGLDIASDMARTATSVASSAASAVSSGAGAVIRGAGDAINKAGDAVKDFFGFDGLGELGEPVTVAATAAATGVAATAGAALETAIAATITAIVAAITAAAGGAISQGATGLQTAATGVLNPATGTTIVRRPVTESSQPTTPATTVPAKDNTTLYVVGGVGIALALAIALKR